MFDFAWVVSKTNLKVICMSITKSELIVPASFDPFTSCIKAVSSSTQPTKNTTSQSDRPTLPFPPSFDGFTPLIGRLGGRGAYSTKSQSACQKNQCPFFFFFFRESVSAIDPDPADVAERPSCGKQTARRAHAASGSHAHAPFQHVEPETRENGHF